VILTSLSGIDISNFVGIFGKDSKCSCDGKHNRNRNDSCNRKDKGDKRDNSHKRDNSDGNANHKLQELLSVALDGPLRNTKIQSKCLMQSR
jgi:hypothetical protein